MRRNRQTPIALRKMELIPAFESAALAGSVAKEPGHFIMKVTGQGMLVGSGVGRAAAAADPLQFNLT